jgi:glutamine amidotransferase
LQVENTPPVLHTPRRSAGQAAGRSQEAVGPADNSAATLAPNRSMCRFLAYRGDPIYLEDLVAKPRHSLVRQSLHAEQARTVTNGDGFGIGWYGERPEPAVYREVMPAWSDDNLLALASTVRSGLFFAHVRAATGGGIARQNCHPFRHGRWLFMHNGQIGGYPRVRRALESELPDALYAARRGATDSELLFLLALARIERGEAPSDAVRRVFDHTAALMRDRGIAEPLRFAAALADGDTIHAFRLSTDATPPTLYRRRDAQRAIVASEPLDDGEGEQWQPLAVGEVVTLRAAH